MILFDIPKRIIVLFFHCISQDKILISYNVMYINTLLNNIKHRIQYQVNRVFYLKKIFCSNLLFHYLKALSIPICQIRLYLRVTFDDCNFFFFFCHSLALCSNDKQIVFLCQPIPRHTSHTQWLINSGGKYIIFRN